MRKLPVSHSDEDGEIDLTSNLDLSLSWSRDHEPTNILNDNTGLASDHSIVSTRLATGEYSAQENVTINKEGCSEGCSGLEKLRAVKNFPIQPWEDKGDT